jgi:hypothetical protein
MPFRIPFAGVGEFFTPDSVLSHCYGALLPMFTTKEATTLRQLCREFKSTVADFPWEDDETVILGSVASWRTCFPRARWANVRMVGEGCRTSPVVDADFVHFVGLRRLFMNWCTSITDAAFVHLRGIHTLDMSACNQATITDAAFVHLKGIYSLDMSLCRQPSITDAAFAHLKGIHSLRMIFCNQATITDSAFSHLTGIHSLSLSCCRQLTSVVFSHLKGIKRLNIAGCHQLNLTDASLSDIEWLNMTGHSRAQRDQAERLGYPVIQANDPPFATGF